jgi:hypothetical protein
MDGCAVEEAVKEAVAAEREACAQIAAEHWNVARLFQTAIAPIIATKIRNRSNPST